MKQMHIKKTLKAFIKFKKRKWFKTNKKPFLQIHLAEHCDLNCKSCAHFSPIAEKKFIDVEELEKMYRNLQSREQWFSRLELMGGEPLLHPSIEKILVMTRSYFPKLEIRVVTNGVKLFKMPDSFYKTCSENNIIVYISIYPISLNYDLLCYKLKLFNVSYGKYGEYDGRKTFINYKLDLQGKHNVKYNYNNCTLGGRCLQLKDNRIFSCFLSAYSEHLNRYFNVDFAWTEDDYLIVDEKLTLKQFHKFINNPVPFCRYCDIKHLSQSDWAHSEKKSEEWLL